MLINITKIKIYSANINAILLIIGYPLFTSIAFGVDTDVDSTRSISIMYRVFILLNAMLLFILCVREKKYVNKHMKLFFLFWFLYLLRIFFDLYISSDSHIISSVNRNFLIQFIVGGVFLPVCALWISLEYLRIKKIVYSILFFSGFIIIKWILTNYFLAVENIGRASLNVAQSTLAFGRSAALLAVTSYSVFRIKDGSYLFKFISIGLFCLGFFSVGIAGSRGPFVALLISILIPYFTKKIGITIGACFFLFFVIYFFGRDLLMMLKDIAPILENRISATIYSNDTSGRDIIFKEVVNKIFENPVFGYSFLLDKTDITSTAHNAILNVAMSLGLFIGVLHCYFYYLLLKGSSYLIKLRDYSSLFGFFVIFFIVYSITTGGDFLRKEDFNASILILLFLSKDKNMPC